MNNINEICAYLIYASVTDSVVGYSYYDLKNIKETKPTDRANVCIAVMNDMSTYGGIRLTPSHIDAYGWNNAGTSVQTVVYVR